MELDGAGGLLGTRVLQRRVAIPHESIPLDFHGRWESVEQELSGTPCRGARRAREDEPHGRSEPDLDLPEPRIRVES